MSDDEINKALAGTVGDIFSAISKDCEWASEKYGESAPEVLRNGQRIIDIICDLDDDVACGAVAFAKRWLKQEGMTE